jgi:hypothetical protein
MNAYEWAAQVDFSWKLEWHINADYYPTPDYKYAWRCDGILSMDAAVKGAANIGRRTMACKTGALNDPTTQDENGFPLNYLLRSGYGCLDRWNLVGRDYRKALAYNGTFSIETFDPPDAEYWYYIVNPTNPDIIVLPVSADYYVDRKVGNAYISAPFQKRQLPAWDESDPFHNGYKDYYDHFAWKAMPTINLGNPILGEGGFPMPDFQFSAPSQLYKLGSTQFELSLFLDGVSIPAGTATITVDCSKLA